MQNFTSVFYHLLYLIPCSKCMTKNIAIGPLSSMKNKSLWIDYIQKTSKEWSLFNHWSCQSDWLYFSMVQNFIPRYTKY